MRLIFEHPLLDDLLGSVSAMRFIFIEMHLKDTIHRIMSRRYPLAGSSHHRYSRFPDREIFAHTQDLKILTIKRIFDTKDEES